MTRSTNALSLVLGLFMAFQAFGAEERHPNIVFLLADDLGYGDLGCYGNTENRTPNIDRLADQGVRFTDFHSSGPMCTPTRAATLTGLYQHRFGTTFHGAISGVRDYDKGLPLDAVTIAEVLGEAGYATGCFGKWHLGYHPPFLPPSQGFDEYRGLASGDGDYHTHVDRSGRPDWWDGNELRPEQGYTTELLTRHAVDFLRRHRDEPFFLYVPHLAIHFPWQGPLDPPHRQAGTDYANDKWGVIPDRSNVRPHVTAMIEALDRGVGTVLETLDQLGLDRKTLVVFTSDNGGYLRYAGGFERISSNGPLRGQKGQLYEGGHRVPAIVRWPGKISPGVTDATAHSTDWFPTLARAAGVDVSGYELDGVDLTSLLVDGTPLPDRALFWWMNDLAVRQGPWKLVVTRTGKTELYRLDEDLGETRNLAADSPERVAELRRQLNAWREEMERSAQRWE